MSAPVIFSKVRSQIGKMLFNNKANYYLEPLAEKYFPKHSLVHKKAQVVSCFKEREDILSLTLKTPKSWKGFRPGQFVEIGVKMNAVFYSRIFSISSGVQQYLENQTITLTIQRQYKGKVTNWIVDSLKPGELVTISDASGEFMLPPTNEDVLFIAGGSGITPFRSMLQKCKKESRNAVLLYYARSEQHIFKEELTRLAETKSINVHFIESDLAGRISLPHLQVYCPDFNFRKIYICGPNTMMEDSRTLLMDNHVKEELIVSEHFSATSFLPSINPDENKSQVKLNSRIIQATGNRTILELLESSGLHPKHGCRMGLCKQCQCTKKNGKVYNTLTRTFSESTEETIQICVSIPVGDVQIDL